VQLAFERKLLLPEREQDWKRCPHCGAQNSPSAQFCSLCLTRFSIQRDEQAKQAGREGETAEDGAPESQETEHAGSCAGGDEPQAGRGAEDLRAPPGEMWADEALDPALQFDLEALRSRPVSPRARTWAKILAAASAVFVVLSLAVAVLGTLTFRAYIDDRGPSAPAAPPTEPAPAQPAVPSPQPPVQPQGSPSSHPDLSFVAPPGWRVEGVAANIVLSHPDTTSSADIQIQSWVRQQGGPYGFVSGPLQSSSEAQASEELARLVSDYVTSSGAGRASSFRIQVGGVTARGAEGEDAASGRHWRAVGLIHGDWSYFVVGRARGQAELAPAMESLLDSVRFKT